jgi:hypothetical protein
MSSFLFFQGLQLKFIFERPNSPKNVADIDLYNKPEPGKKDYLQDITKQPICQYIYLIK